MNCLLAILLLTDQTSQVNDRLAIVSLGTDNNLHEMYNPEGMRQFNSVRSSDDIMMARSPTNGAGTYITIYCSPSQTITALSNFITAGATRLPNGPQKGFQQDQESELGCYNHVQTELNNAGSQFSILANDLVKNDQCTQSMLYSLQFQGRISCVTPDMLTNAPQSKYSGKVLFTELFKMESVVLKRSFLMTQGTASVQFGLAWHQGNLKLFARKNGSLVWHPTNNLKQDSEDFKHILPILINSLLEIGLIRTELNMGKYMPDLIPGRNRHSGTSKASARQ